MAVAAVPASCCEARTTVVLVTRPRGAREVAAFDPPSHDLGRVEPTTRGRAAQVRAATDACRQRHTAVATLPSPLFVPAIVQSIPSHKRTNYTQYSTRMRALELHYSCTDVLMSLTRTPAPGRTTHATPARERMHARATARVRRVRPYSTRRRGAAVQYVAPGTASGLVWRVTQRCPRGAGLR